MNLPGHDLFGHQAAQGLKLPDTYYHPVAYWAHMVTFRCDGNCPYCIVNGRGEHVPRKELSGKEILNWWNGLYHQKGHRLSLIGGETTLHKDIYEIVAGLENYNITITTNCKGVFYARPDFAEKLKPHPTSTLRVNTSYHPHAVSADRYIDIIQRFRAAGHYVDQTAFVYTPDVMEKYGTDIQKVNSVIPLKSPPYLGFYNKKTKSVNAPASPEDLLPDENYWDQESARVMCGIDDYDLYRDMCGQQQGRYMVCNHPLVSLLVAPNGEIFGCHYKLYYNIEPITNIFSDFVISDLQHPANRECNCWGYCNFCDYPRQRVVTVPPESN